MADQEILVIELEKIAQRKFDFVGIPSCNLKT